MTLARRRPAGTLAAWTAAVTLAAAAAGCGTIQVPMAPRVGKLEVAPLPVEAALLVTPETRDRVLSARPERSIGSARTHAFPLGAALESASRQVFSQVFEMLTIVRTLEEAKRYRLLIEPSVTEFRFRYEEGFTVAAVAAARVRVTVATGETTLWDRTVESPEQRSGAWVVNLSYERNVGEAASAALVAALRQIATELAGHPSVKQTLGR